MDGVDALSYDNRINAGEALFLPHLKSGITAGFQGRTDNNLGINLKHHRGILKRIKIDLFCVLKAIKPVFL